MRILLISVGTLCVGLGAVGVVLPGLPATPFFLAAAACFVRSSDRLYNWLMQHKTFGVFVRNFYRDGGMTRKARIISLTAMWCMITLSGMFFLHTLTARVILLSVGIIGTIVILLMPRARTI